MEEHEQLSSQVHVSIFVNFVFTYLKMDGIGPVSRQQLLTLESFKILCLNAKDS